MRLHCLLFRIYMFLIAYRAVFSPWNSEPLSIYCFPLSASCVRNWRATLVVGTEAKPEMVICSIYSMDYSIAH